MKRFRRLLRRLKQGLEVLRVAKVCSSQMTPSSGAKADLLNEGDSKLRVLLTKFEEVFQEELRDGLPPKRDLDHAIEILPGRSTPHRPLYKLSPTELVTAVDYVDKLLWSGKIRPSRSPYSCLLFFVEEPGRPLWGVADYRGLNRITKRHNASLPRCDEMFARLGKARYFSN